MQKRLRDPVVAADGFTYERNAVTAFFEAFEGRQTPSPMTGRVLRSTALVPNYTVRDMLELLAPWQRL